MSTHYPIQEKILPHTPRRLCEEVRRSNPEMTSCPHEYSGLPPAFAKATVGTPHLAQVDSSQRRLKEKGIILLEAIVAIGVLVMIAGAVLVLVVRSTSGTRSATDQLTATYLAQDVAEWLVAKKQYNKKTGASSWHDDMECAVSSCGVDTTGVLDTMSVSDCATLNTCILSRNNSTGVYTHDIGAGQTSTPYKRTITVEEKDLDALNAGMEVAVYTITVSWDNGARTESLPLTLTLYED